MSQQKGVFSQPCYASGPNSISKADESIFSLAWLLWSSGVHFCLMKSVWKARSRELTLLWASFLSPASVGCGDGHGMLSLQACGKSNFCKVSLLVQVPVHGASYLSTTDGVRKSKNWSYEFLVPFCCSPPLQVMQQCHLLPAPLHRATSVREAQPSLDCISVENNLTDHDPNWSQHPAGNECLAPLLFDYCFDA